MCNNASSLVRERELILKLIDDDEEAFCELYSIYKNKLIHFAIRFLKSRTLAEDIFQDTFTVIWQSRKFINPESPFSAFLYTVMRNRIMNVLREQDYQERLKQALLANAVDTTVSAESETLSKDLKEEIDQAMENLTPRQREIFHMSRELDMSHKEIGQALDISVETVQKHISTSLKTIREYFSKHAEASADLLLLIFVLYMKIEIF